MFIAGNDSADGKFRSGISFSLSKKSPVSYTHEIATGSWEVEFLKGYSEVIARTLLMMTLEELQAGGFEAIQLALDNLSVKGIFSTYLNGPLTTSIGVYCVDSRSVAYVHSLLDFPMSVSAKMQLIDASGKEIKSPLPPEPIWNESFRYYRLSQSSSDLFEAYRNLFLAFEALLNTICPKKDKKDSEGEVAWLRRSLTTVNSRSSLANLTPSGSGDPVEYIVISQYKNVRCKLQHAKFPAATLPHSHLNPMMVNQAYGELIRIWRQIAGLYLHVPTGGGVITYAGFELMIGNVFREGTTIVYTSDNSQPHKEEAEVSLQSFPVHEFVTSNYMGQVNPGVLRLIAHEDTASLSNHYTKPIHRVYSRIQGAPFGIEYIENGLLVSGVDSWECIQDFRLINASQPNIQFKT